MLQHLGLSSDEERAYEAVASRGSLTFEDLLACWADIAPTNAEARALLHRMTERGLLNLVVDEPSRYIAARADLALEGLVLEQEKTLLEVRSHIEALARLQSAKTNESWLGELLEVVRGREAIHRRVIAMFREAEHEFRGIDKPPYVAAEPGSDPDEREFLRQGKVVRSLYDAASFDVPGVAESVEQLVKSGEEARVIAGVPIKLTIADDRVALLPLRLSSAVDIALLVHPCALLDALIALFETYWSLATPLTSRDGLAGSDLDAPTPDEQRILALLRAGTPDKGIASHLGISRRTLQRRLNVLYGRVGAHTRFDFALLARDRGWVSGGPPRP